jgi:xylulokinase
VSREACTLGIDLGTRSVKAMLLSDDGRTLGLASAGYDVSAPHPGWAESSPDDWWQAVAVSVREACAAHRGAEVRAIGLSGQMHGVVLCHADSRPVRPAVLWADQRARGELDTFRDLAPPLRSSLGNPLAAGMAGPILRWLSHHEADAARGARWALQPKDWLRLCMTGIAGAEHSDASATLLYDIQSETWASPVLGSLGLNPKFLAPIAGSATVAGELLPAAAHHLGLPVGIPIAHGGADAPCAALGLGLVAPGRVMLSVGTGAQFLAPTASARPHPQFLTHAFRGTTESGWYAMAAVQNAGLALEWVLSGLGANWDAAYEALAETPPGAGGVTFLPYLSGERTPLMDANVRGGWMGVGLEHDRSHLLRAAFEGVAFALKHALAAFETLNIDPTEFVVAGGGATHPVWRTLLADVLESPLTLTSVDAASARGAALLAQVAIGWFDDVAATAASAPAPTESTAPSPSSGAYDAPYAAFIDRTFRAAGRRIPG